MINEAIRKRLLTNYESFAPKRWEGKPWSNRFKFLLANYPEMLLCSIVCFAVAPVLCFIRTKTFEGSMADGLQKYRAHYTVVRHDDPQVERLMKQKEIGREHFPK